MIKRIKNLVSYQIFRKTPNDTIIFTADIIEYINDILKRKKDLGVLLDTYTTTQQNALKIIAVSNGTNMFEDSLLRDYDIKTSSLQSALKSLIEKGVI